MGRASATLIVGLMAVAGCGSRRMRPADAGADAAEGTDGADAASEPEPDLVDTKSADVADKPIDAPTEPIDAAPVDTPAKEPGVDVPAGACFPTCFTDVMKDCMSAGPCMTETVGSTTVICFASGVKLVAELMSMVLHLTAYKADGKICYTAEGVGDGMGMVTYVYKDASDKEIARYVTTSTADGFTSFTVTCGGVTYDVDPMSDPCTMPDGGAVACTMGTCP